jgi:hypothetical protein
MWFYLAERYGEFDRNWRLSAIIRSSAEADDDINGATPRAHPRTRAAPDADARSV